MAMTDGQDASANLVQELQRFWEDYTGIRPARVRVVTGEQTVAVCLEQVMAPAERQMASTQDGRDALEKLEAHILDQAKPYLELLVGRAMEQEGILAQVHFDMTSGNVLGFFRAA